MAVSLTEEVFQCNIIKYVKFERGQCFAFCRRNGGLFVVNVALIIAGGVGARMNMSTPKQFFSVKGKPIIIYTLEAFQRNDSIDAIAVVCLEGWEDILLNYSRKYGIDKLRWITKGGDSGFHSLRNGMLLLKENCDPNDVIVIHDAVRPLVTDDIINSNIAGVIQNGTAITVVPTTEALLYSEDNEKSSKVVDRKVVWRTQTPQSLRLSKLIWAHEEAVVRGITDTVATCTLLVELGEDVYFVPGNGTNFKITSKDDVALLEAYLDAGNKK